MDHSLLAVLFQETTQAATAIESIKHPDLSKFLVIAAILFVIGIAGVLTRRNLLVIFMSIELILNAANLNFIAFWRYGPNPQLLTGVMFVIFSIGVAAAEAAVGLALIISIYRHYKTANVDQINSMKG